MSTRNADRWTNWAITFDRAISTPGTPVPGTGGHHSLRKSHTGGNKVGAITHPNKEWSSKGRKQEEHLTGIAKRAEEDAIAEGLAEMEISDRDWITLDDVANCWDDTNVIAYNDMWADGGDIYAGTYQGDL